MNEIKKVALEIADITAEVTANNIKLRQLGPYESKNVIDISYAEWEELTRWVEDVKKIFTTRPEVKP